MPSVIDDIIKAKLAEAEQPTQPALSDIDSMIYKRLGLNLGGANVQPPQSLAPQDAYQWSMPIPPQARTSSVKAPLPIQPDLDQMMLESNLRQMGVTPEFVQQELAKQQGGPSIVGVDEFRPTPSSLERFAAGAAAATARPFAGLEQIGGGPTGPYGRIVEASETNATGTAGKVGSFVGGMISFVPSMLVPELAVLPIFGSAFKTSDDIYKETGNLPAAVGAGTLEAVAAGLGLKIAGGVFGKAAQESVGRMMIQGASKQEIAKTVGAILAGSGSVAGINETTMIVDQLQRSGWGTQDFATAAENIKAATPETIIGGAAGGAMMTGGGAAHAALRGSKRMKADASGASETPIRTKADEKRTTSPSTKRPATEKSGSGSRLEGFDDGFLNQIVEGNATIELNRKTVTKQEALTELEFRRGRQTVVEDYVPGQAKQAETPTQEPVNVKEATQTTEVLNGQKTPTVPEKPETLALQLEMVKAGDRKAMLVTQGEQMPAVPSGLNTAKTPAGTFIYDPAKIKAGEIRKAVRENRIGDVLDYGVPAKPAPGTETGVVTVRTRDGTEKSAVVVDEASTAPAITAAAKIVKPGDEIAIETPQQVITTRQESNAETVRSPQVEVRSKEGGENLRRIGQDESGTVQPGKKAASQVKQLADITDDQVKQAAKAIGLDARAKPAELRKQLADLGVVSEQNKPSLPRPSVTGARRGFIDIGVIEDAIKGTIKAGQWVARSTVQAAQWLSTKTAATFKAARLILEKTFGKGITRFAGRIWRAVKEFFGGPPDTSKLAGKPVSKGTISTLIRAIRQAKPIRKEFEAMKKAERSERAAVMRGAQEGIGGEAALNLSLKAQKGEFQRPTQGFEPIKDKISQEQRDEIFDHIWTHELGGAPQARMGISNVIRNIIDHGYLPTEGEIARIEDLFGRAFTKAILSKKFSLPRRVSRFLLDIWNVPKSIKSAWDISAVGRQGLPLTLAQPGKAARASAEMLAAFGNEKFAQKVYQRLVNDPDYQNAIDDGLYLPSIHGTMNVAAREEMFQSQLLQRIPVIRTITGVRPSERAYITYLNLMRLNAYKQGKALSESSGLNRENNLADFKKLAKFINAASGRGNYDMGDLGPFLNAAFFSPRMMVANVEAPARAAGAIAMAPSRPALAMVASRQLIAHSVFILTIAGLLKALKMHNPEIDAEVETNPVSSRFLKVTMDKGRTSIDLTGGRARALSVIAQMIFGERETKSGEIVKSSPIMSAAWWAAGKLAPTPQVMLSIREGKRFGGKPVTTEGIAADLVAPITLQNLQEVVEQHGMEGLWLMLPEVLGFGTSTQEPKEEKSPTRPQRPARPRRPQPAG